jgi:hypothetical protein
MYVCKCGKVANYYCSNFIADLRCTLSLYGFTVPEYYSDLVDGSTVRY